MVSNSLETLKKIQSHWRPGDSLDKAMLRFVRIPGTQRLVEKSSTCGWFLHAFSIQSSHQRLLDIQHVAMEALEQFQGAKLTSIDPQFLAALWSKKIAQWNPQSTFQASFCVLEAGAKASSFPAVWVPSISPLILPMLERVEEIAQRQFKGQSHLLHQEVSYALAALRKGEALSSSLTELQITQLLLEDQTVHGKAQLQLWTQSATHEQEQGIDGVIEAVKEHHQLYKQIRSLASPLEREQWAKKQALHYTARLDSLSVGESCYFQSNIGVQAFWFSKLWSKLKDVCGIETGELEIHLQEAFKSGEPPDLNQWIDNLFNKLLPPSVIQAADIAASPLNTLYKYMSPLLPHEKRKSELLRSLFPIAIAQFLESKEAGGAIELLSPLLPSPLVFSNQLLGNLKMDGKHSMSQTLRKRAHEALEKLVGKNSHTLDGQIIEWLQAPEKLAHRAPDDVFCRESLIKTCDGSYNTPFSAVLKVIKLENQGYEVEVFSSGTPVSRYHPLNAAGARCSFYFPLVTSKQLDSSFFYRWLEWSYMGLLEVQTADPAHFYEHFLATLGQRKIRESIPLEPDSDPYFNTSRILQVAGFQAQQVKQKTLQLYLQALRQICSDHESELLSLNADLDTTLVERLSCLVRFLQKQQGAIKQPGIDWPRVLKAVRERIEMPKKSKKGGLADQLDSYRRKIAHSLHEHPVLMRWVLGDSAEPIVELLKEKLQLSDLDIGAPIQLSDWLTRNSHLLLECGYGLGVVTTLWAVGSLSGALHLSFSAASFLLRSYLYHKVDWKSVLPADWYHRLKKVESVYMGVWTWIWLHIRELLVGVLLKIIRSTPALQSLQNTLDLIEEHKAQIQEFLKGASPLSSAIDPLLNPLDQLGKSLLTTGAAGVQVAPMHCSLQLVDHGAHAQPLLTQFPFYLNPELHLTSPHDLSNWLQSIAKMDPLPSHEDLLVAWRHWPLSNDERSITFWGSVEKPQEALKHLVAIISRYQVLCLPPIDLWELQATALMASSALYGNWKNSANGTAGESAETLPAASPSPFCELQGGALLDQLAGLWPDQQAKQQVSLQIQSPIQGMRIKQLVSHLGGWKSQVSWQEIETQLRSLKQSLKKLYLDKEPLTAPALSLLPTLVDSLLPTASPTIWSAQPLRRTLPYSWTGGVHPEYNKGYEWIGQCREMLRGHPHLLSKLIELACRWMEKNEDWKITFIDQETLLLAIFQTLLTPHAGAEQEFGGLDGWLYWMRLQAVVSGPSLISYLTCKGPLIDLPWEKVWKDQSSKLEDFNDLFAKKCHLFSELEASKWLHQQDALLKSEALNRSHNPVALMVYPYSEGITIQAAHLDSHLHKDLRGVEESTWRRTTRDIDESSSSSWPLLTTQLSFLTSDSQWLAHHPAARRQLMRQFDSLTLFDDSLHQEASFVYGMEICWNSLWKGAPPCPLYRYWLLQLALKMQSWAYFNQKAVQLPLIEALSSWMDNLSSELGQQYVAALIAQAGLLVSFHPSTLASMAFKTRAASLYWAHPWPTTYLDAATCSKLAKSCRFDLQEVGDLLCGHKRGFTDREVAESMDGFTHWLDSVDPQLIGENLAQSMSHRLQSSPVKWEKERPYTYFSETVGYFKLGSNQLLKAVHNPVQTIAIVNQWYIFKSLSIDRVTDWKSDGADRWVNGSFELQFNPSQPAQLYHRYKNQLYAYSYPMQISVNCPLITSWMQENPHYHVFKNDKGTLLKSSHPSSAMICHLSDHSEGYILTQGKKAYRLKELPSHLLALRNIDAKGWQITESEEGQWLELSHEARSLRFVKEGSRWYEAGVYKGYWIADQQSLYAHQLPWDSYLVLENAKHAKMVLVSQTAQIPSAFSKQFLPQLPLVGMVSYTLAAYYGVELLGGFFDHAVPLSAYLLNEDGVLSSNNFSSLIQLFISYCLQNRFDTALQTLHQIQNWLCGAEAAHISDSDWVLLAAQYSNPSIKLLRLKLVSAWMQRHMMQGEHGQAHLHTHQLQLGKMVVAAVCMADYNYLLDNAYLTLDQLHVDVRDEVAILQFAKRVQSHLVHYLVENVEGKFSHVKFLSKHDLSVAVECTLYPKAVWQRKKEIHSWKLLDVKGQDWSFGWQTLCEMGDQALQSYDALLEEFTSLSLPWFGPQTVGSLAKSSLDEVVDYAKSSDSLEQLQSWIIEMCHSGSGEYAIDLGGNLTHSSLVKHLMRFYAIAQSPGWTDEKLWLKRQLALYSGGWSSPSRAALEFLQSVLQQPGHYPLSSALITWIKHSAMELGDPKVNSALYEIKAQKKAEAITKLNQMVQRHHKQLQDRLHAHYCGVVANHALSTYTNTCFNALIHNAIGVPKVTLGAPLGVFTAGLKLAKTAVKVGFNQWNSDKVERVAYPPISRASGSIKGGTSTAGLALVDDRIECALNALKRYFKLTSLPLDISCMGLLLPFKKSQDQWDFYRLDQGLSDWKLKEPSSYLVEWSGPHASWQLFNELHQIQVDLIASKEGIERSLEKLISPHVLVWMGKEWLNRLTHALARREKSQFFGRLAACDIEFIEQLVATRQILLSRINQLDQIKQILSLMIAPHSGKGGEPLKKLYEQLVKPRSWNIKETPWELALAMACFEGQCKLWLTHQQVQDMALALTHDKDIVYEVIMGGGKTLVGESMNTHIASLMGLPIQMFPSNIIQEGGDTVAKQSSKAFGILSQRMILHPAPSDEASWMERMEMLRASAQAKQSIKITPEDGESLLLHWISGLYLASTGIHSVSDRSLKIMGEMVSLMKKNGILIADESHVVGNPKRCLRVPLGHRVPFKSDYLEWMSELWMVLNQETSLIEDLQTQKAYNQKKEVTLQLYSRVAAKKMEESYQLVGLETYLCDLQSPVSMAIGSHYAYEKFCLFRGILVLCLPHALEGAENVSFGLNTENPHAPDIPYRSSGSPIKGSVIKNPFEAMVNTFISHFAHGIDPSIGAAEILQIAMAKVGLGGSSMLNATCFALIEHIESHQSWKLKLQLAMKHSDLSHLRPVAVCLAHHPLMVSAFIACRVVENLEAWSMSMSCNPQMLGWMFARKISGTGTAGIDGIYPASVHVKRDPSSVVDATMTLIAKTDRVATLKSDCGDLILEELIQNYLNPGTPIRVWIDGGALLKGIPMQKIAQKIGQKLKDVIDVVLYYEDDLLQAWDIERQESNSAEVVQVSENRRFTLYGHSQTFGANIPQGDVAALLLLGLQCNFQDLLQQAYRMRRLKDQMPVCGAGAALSGQTLTLVLSASAGKLFKTAPTVHDVIRLAMGNELEVAKDLHFEAAIQKLQAVILYRCLDQLIEAKSLAAQKELMGKFAKLFIEYQDINAQNMFGGQFSQKSAQAILREMAHRSLKSAASSGVDMEGLDAQMQKLLEDLPALPGQILVGESKLLPTLGFQTNMSQQIAHQQHQQSCLKEIVATYKPMPWSLSFSLSNFVWINQSIYAPMSVKAKPAAVASGVFLHSLRSLLNNDASLKMYSSWFDESIYLTNNLFPIQGASVEGTAQLGSLIVRPCRTALICIDEWGGVRALIALSSKDHKYWCARIKLVEGASVHYCVWDIHQMRSVAYSVHWPGIEPVCTFQMYVMLLELRVALGYCQFSYASIKTEMEKWMASTSVTHQGLVDMLRKLMARSGMLDVNRLQLIRELIQQSYPLSLSKWMDFSSLNLASLEGSSP